MQWAAWECVAKNASCGEGVWNRKKEVLLQARNGGGCLNKLESLGTCTVPCIFKWNDWINPGSITIASVLLVTLIVLVCVLLKKQNSSVNVAELNENESKHIVFKKEKRHLLIDKMNMKLNAKREICEEFYKTETISYTDERSVNQGDCCLINMFLVLLISEIVLHSFNFNN